MSAELQSALQALYEQLDSSAAADYWSTLSRFLRFEIEKPEFDERATAAVGKHVALHNRVIFAMLKDAQAEEQVKSEPGRAHPFTAFKISAPQSSGAVDEVTAPGSSNLDPTAAAAGTGDNASSAGPKLMLKIRSDGSASAQRTDLTVDPQEEAQVRKLSARPVCLSCMLHPQRPFNHHTVSSVPSMCS